MLEGFKRRMNMGKKNKSISERIKVGEISADNVAKTSLNDVDIAVSNLMDVEEPKPFSSDRSLVNDMVAFARENDIELPKFTSKPDKIAAAIVEWAEKK
jgi:hypothetical protein